MSREQTFTFYSYSRVDENCDNRWANTGVPEIFFCDEESARKDLYELREDIESETENSWSPMQLEKIETVPISKESLLALLNYGMGAIVKSYEIIDVIE